MHRAGHGTIAKETGSGTGREGEQGRLLHQQQPSQPTWAGRGAWVTTSAVTEGPFSGRDDARQGPAELSARTNSILAPGEDHRPPVATPTTPVLHSTTAQSAEPRPVAPAEPSCRTARTSPPVQIPTPPAPLRQNPPVPSRVPLAAPPLLRPPALPPSQATPPSKRQPSSFAAPQHSRIRSQTHPVVDHAGVDVRGRTATAPNVFPSTSASSLPAPSAGSSSAIADLQAEYSALFAVTPGTSGASIALFEGVCRQIVKLAMVGGFRLESRLEATVTLPLLRRDRLPTNRSGLKIFLHDIKRRVVPGITPQDYLDTFERWQKFVSKTGDVTFPICGPTVASFLQAATDLDSGERPKIVWILEQYRKCTIGAYAGIGPDAGWRRKVVREWGDADWLAWDRFIELSRIRLGEWKIIEELAPPAPANLVTSVGSASRAKTSVGISSSVPNDSFAPRKVPLPADSSHKARGKRPVDDPSQPSFSLASALRDGQPCEASPVHPYGLTRLGQPRQKPFRRRKLPPQEQQADADFYVAVGLCSLALKRARTCKLRREVQQRPQNRSHPAVPAAAPPLYPYEPPLRNLPPYSDYTPSLSLAKSALTRPIIAFSTLPSSFSLASPSPSLTTRCTPSQTISTFLLPVTCAPLPPDLAPRSLTSTSKSSGCDSAQPRFTLTPNHFLSYPRALTLPSRLSRQDQLDTYKLACDLRGHDSITQVEDVLEESGVGPDESERRKKEALEKLVKSATSSGLPAAILVVRGGVLAEPREPEEAAKARRRITTYPPPPTRNVPVERGSGPDEGKGNTSAASVKGLEAKGAVLEGPASHARKGKRKAPDDDGSGEKEAHGAGTRSDGVEQDGTGQSREESSRGHNLLSFDSPPVAPPIDVNMPRSAPVIPTLSTSASPSIPVNSANLQLRRPSLNAVSVSAPVVPQQIQPGRSKSSAQEPPPKMRRRSSITTPGPGVHPLAHLYAIQSPQFRQGARLKAATIVAATKSGIIPAAKSPLIAAKVLSEGAVLPKGGPRTGFGGSALAKIPRTVPKPASPPLVPILLHAELHGARSGKEGRPETEMEEGPKDSANDISGSLEPLSIASTSSTALGVILELPSPRQASTSTTNRLEPRRNSQVDTRSSAAPHSAAPPDTLGSTNTVPISAETLDGGQNQHGGKCAPDLVGAPPGLAASFSASVPTPSLAASVLAAGESLPLPRSPRQELVPKGLTAEFKFRAEVEREEEPHSLTVSAGGGNWTSLGKDNRLEQNAVQDRVLGTRDGGKGKVTATGVPVEGSPIARKDHPLRRIPKRVLAASEPVFPFGRLP